MVYLLYRHTAVKSNKNLKHQNNIFYLVLITDNGITNKKKFFSNSNNNNNINDLSLIHI